MCGGPIRPLHKIHGHWGTKMSANAGLVTVETYVQQGKQLKTSFHIWTYLVFQLSFHPYLYTSEISK